MGPCHHGMPQPQVPDVRDCLWIWREAVNTLNKHSQTDDKGWPYSLGIGWRLQLLTIRKQCVTKCYTGPQYWTDCLNDPGNGKWMEFEHVLLAVSIGQIHLKQ